MSKLSFGPSLLLYIDFTLMYNVHLVFVNEKELMIHRSVETFSGK